MIQLIWPNGEITTGKTFEDVELAVRMAQWSTFDLLRDFRVEMRARAFIWSGDKISIDGSSEEFVRAMHSANMFMMFE